MRHLHRRALTSDQAAAVAAELGEDEFESRVQPICIGPAADGSRTLSDAAHELHGFALWLVELERDGWQLIRDAEDAHLHVINGDPSRRLDDPTPDDV